MRSATIAVPLGVGVTAISGGRRAPAVSGVAIGGDPAGDEWIRPPTGTTPACSTADLTRASRTGVNVDVHDAAR